MSQNIHISKFMKIRQVGAELFRADRHDEPTVNQICFIIFYVFTWNAKWKCRAAPILKYLHRQDYTSIESFYPTLSNVSQQNISTFTYFARGKKKERKKKMLSSKINKPLMLLSDEQPTLLSSVRFRSVLCTFTVRHGLELWVWFCVSPTTDLLPNLK